jgi:hypothetical protein
MARLAIRLTMAAGLETRRFYVGVNLALGILCTVAHQNRLAD